MFDIYNTHRSFPNTYVNTTEKRAPTDDSIRLAKEYQEKAKDNLIAQYELENNILKAKWWVFENPSDWNFKFHCKFMLNDKDYSFDFIVNRYDFKNDKDDIHKQVYKKILERVSVVLTTELVYKDDVREIFCRNFL